MRALFDMLLGAVVKLVSKTSTSVVQEENYPDLGEDLDPKGAKGYNYKIVIDPGHGGKKGRPDPGAVGVYDNKPVYERDVVLKIAVELAELLDRSSFNVVLTRIDADIQSTLPNKVAIIRDEKPDIVVSIHANANAGKPARGIETFFSSSKRKSKLLAECIQDSMMNVFPDHRNRGVKEGSRLYMLRAHKVEGCCLVECEFINNKKQAKFLVDNYRQIAFAIYKGILAYCDSL